MAKMNSTTQKHQQKTQDNALDAVDPTFKIHVQNTQINLARDPWTHHL